MKITINSINSTIDLLCDQHFRNLEKLLSEQKTLDNSLKKKLNMLFSETKIIPNFRWEVENLKFLCQEIEQVIRHERSAINFYQTLKLSN